MRIPLRLSLYDEDLSREKDQGHFGLFEDSGRLIACVIAVIHPTDTARIRQMAVRTSHQGQGHGRALVLWLETYLASRNIVQLHLHARISAVGFYEKSGYRRQGPEFFEVGLPHVRMEKRVVPNQDAL